MDYASIVGLVTFLVMMVMIFAGIPVFVSMLASAFGGFIALYQGNLTMMITKFTTAPFELGANYNYAVLPMFMLVGALAGETGIAGGAFAAMKAWLGRVKGGQLFTVVAANAVFGACSGSSSSVSWLCLSWRPPVMTGTTPWAVSLLPAHCPR